MMTLAQDICLFFGRMKAFCKLNYVSSIHFFIIIQSWWQLLRLQQNSHCLNKLRSRLESKRLITGKLFTLSRASTLDLTIARTDLYTNFDVAYRIAWRLKRCSWCMLVGIFHPATSSRRRKKQMREKKRNGKTFIGSEWGKHKRKKKTKKLKIGYNY